MRKHYDINYCINVEVKRSTERFVEGEWVVVLTKAEHEDFWLGSFDQGKKQAKTFAKELLDFLDSD